MATSYPNGLDNFTNPTATDTLDSATVPHATQHANANDAIEAIETELGTNPKGGYASVKARLDAATASDTANEVVKRDANGEFVAGAVTIDSTKTPTSAVGKLYWDGGGTVNLGLAGGNVSVALGENLVSYVTNAEATTLNVGEVVYVYSATGDRPSVKRASNSGESTSSKTLGIVAESIAANGIGFVVTRGIISKLNLGAYTAGQAVYLGATAGTITTTKPSAPNHMVSLGWIIRANNGNGQIYVNVQNGFELEELHNVSITSPANGQVLTYDSATNLWKNEETASPTVPATPTVEGVVYGLTNTDTEPTAFINGGYYPVENTAFGYLALDSETGFSNVAVGVRALETNTGDANTAVGNSALASNTTGSGNLAVGAAALNVNTTGNSNIALGQSSLLANTEGYNNSGIGTSALQSNTTGYNNTAIGYGALLNNLTGSGNVAIGSYAGENETGSNKLYIANNSTTSLIVGDFSADTVTINGNLTATIDGGNA